MKRVPCVLVGICLSGPVAAEPTERSLLDLDLAELMQIQVTAQRRSENLRDVPIAVTVMPGAQVAVIAAAGEDLRVLSSRLPSLQVESSFGRTFPRFYIRGIGNTSFDLNASQPVSLLHDDVVLENPIIKGFPLFDLAQIEMVRGPQGTLFGRNTPAGVIKFESVRPGEGASGFGRLGWGSLGTRTLEAAIAGEPSDGWSARLSLLHQGREDWVDNQFDGPEQGLEGYRDSALRLQLRYVGGDRFEALGRLHARSLDGTARVFRANIIEPGSNRFVSGFRRDRVAHDGANRQELDHHGASLHLRWSFDRFDLHTISAIETADLFSRGDIDGGFGASYFAPMGPGFIPFDSESAAALPRHRQFTQELRVESRSEGRVDWQGGLFWFDEGLTVDNFNYSSTFGAGALDGHAVVDQDNRAWAAFASVGLRVSERLALRTGLRYTDDRKDFAAERSLTPGGGAPMPRQRAHAQADDISGDISALWMIGPQLNGYLRLAKGFRAPSLQGRVVFSDAISQADSETVLSLEMGLKGELLDNRLRFGFGLFRYRMDDPQLTAVGGSGNIARLINAARADGHGMELDLDARIGERLQLNAGLSYNHTAIRDPDLRVSICGAPCTVLDPVVDVAGVPFAVVDGNPLPYAPRWTGQLQLRYGIPVQGGELYLQSDWAWRSGMNFFLYESREFRASSLLEGGLRIGYRWRHGKREVAVFARNITDETALVGAVDFNNLTGMINEPRVVGLELRAGF